jgi:hypothetical protein
LIDDESAGAPLYATVITEPGVPWMRLHFSNVRLDEGGYLIVASHADGSSQKLDAQTLLQWAGRSAYFNGDSVSVALYGSGKVDPYFQMSHVTYGLPPMGASLVALDGICDGDDDREASDHAAIGRMTISFLGASGPPTLRTCTAWITANGFASAGHCFENPKGQNLVSAEVSFNLPASLCDGTIQNAAAIDQYVVDLTTLTWNNPAGKGRDWAVFICNPTQGLAAAERQEAFLRVSEDVLPDDVRVTGFGLDNDPAGCGPGDLNSDSQTQQTHEGGFGGEYNNASDNYWLEYEVDTTVGNSGSPAMIPDGTVAIGIHHDGSCASGSYNAASSFSGSALKAALNGLTPADVVYVDTAHPTTVGEGTVLRPYETVTAGVTGASAGDTLAIFGGSYDESLVITTELLLEAVWGTVIIGGN